MGEYDSDLLHVCDIDIYRCESCGHMQIPAHIDEEYYHEYTMGSFWGASFTELRKKQVQRLAMLAPARKQFLDIGCGVGHYLTLAREHFETVCGVEPSFSSAHAARRRGFTVIHDYFHDGLRFESGFDAISMIEVLEHLEQPAEVFACAARRLNEGGVLLAEVPNGQRIFEKCLYYNLCTDHIQYFSVPSLTQMAKGAGLTVLCVQEAADPNVLELYARKAAPARDSFGERRQRHVEKMISQIPKDAHVAAWGAGAEALCFLAMLEGNIQIRCLFDSDQNKHGHNIARIPIVKPTGEKVRTFDTIILFANAHKQQIQGQLAQLGFTGRLLTFMEI